MASAYDYVQIVVDDDWGLVGIVPNNGSGDRMKKMAIVPTRVKEDIFQIKEESLPKRKIISEAPLVRESKVSQTESSKMINPNSLSGLTASEPNINQVLVSPRQVDHFLGNISDGARVARRKDNVLVGLGGN